MANLDAAVHNELERRRIKVGWAAPVTDRAGVERHQVRQSNLNLVHGETDNGEGRAVINKAKCGFLACTRARAFENNPLALPQVALFGERSRSPP